MSEAERATIKENIAKLEGIGASMSDAVDAKAMGDLLAQLFCDINRVADSLETMVRPQADGPV